jgi:glycosyltransferase involved in cell wall biosynthesis
VCVVRQYYYPFDPRVRREVQALVEMGCRVDVICIRREREPRRERHGLLTVYRLPIAHRRGGIARYVLEYGGFLLAAGALLTLLHLSRGYDLVQVNSMPDALVFAALVPRLMGARVLLDLHECMPEFFATKFGVSQDHPLVRVIALLEQASISFAHSTLTCTDQMRLAFTRRGAAEERIRVVLNAADEAVFDRGAYPASPREAGRLALICHGSVEPLYGLDVAIRAVARLREELPGLTLHIYGDGTHLPDLRALTQELGVPDAVTFTGCFVPMEELLGAIAAADAGVIAIKSDAFRDLVHCNKMYEFIAMGKPVICSRTAAVEAYFDDDCLQFFTSDSVDDLTRAIRQLAETPDLGARMAERAARASELYRWEHQRRRYQTIAAGLIDA